MPSWSVLGEKVEATQAKKQAIHLVWIVLLNNTISICVHI